LFDYRKKIDFLLIGLKPINKYNALCIKLAFQGKTMIHSTFFKYPLALFMVALILSFYSCKKEEEDTPAVPACMESAIVQFDLTKACRYSAKVERYTFQRKTVFALAPGTCIADQTTDIIDIDCNTIGSLGGIAGNTIINGEEFSNAILIETLWEN